MSPSASPQQPVSQHAEELRDVGDADQTSDSTTAVAATGASTIFDWTPGDRQFAFVAGTLILLLTLAHCARLAWRGTPAVEIRRLEAAENRFRLDINGATWVEWMQLEGIGEALSHRIVIDREQNGPFETIDDIQRVHGIGPKTLEQLRPWLHCADCPPQDDASNSDNR